MIILFLIGIVGLGRLIVNALRLTWNRAEGWSLVLLFGYFFGAWMLLLTCAVFGFKIGGIVTVALLMITWLAPETRRPLSLSSFASVRQTVAWFLSTLVMSFVLGGLLYRQMLEPGPGGAYSDAYSGFGTDLPLHLSIITRFAYAPHFSWQFSLMSRTFLTYPFLVDFLTGMFVRWDVGLRLSLLATTIPFCIILVQLLFFLAYRSLGSIRAASIFTCIALIAGNSFSFIENIVTYSQSHPELSRFLSKLPQDITGYTGSEKFGTFISCLVPQRSFQLGLPVFCAVLLLICRLNPKMEIPQRRRIFLFLGVLIGFLPLAHIYSFFVSLAAIGTLVVFDRKIASIREWLLTVITSLAIGLPQVVYQLFSNPHARFLRFSPGWTYTEGEFPHLHHLAGMLFFVFLNFGIILALVAFSYRHLKDRNIVRCLVLLGIVFFIVSFLFVFQPSPYDNAKFLFFGFFFFCLGVSHYLSQLSLAGKWRWVPFTLLLVASGVLNTNALFHQHHVLYTYRALAEAKEFRRQLPSNALVLTSDTIEHPLWGLEGQPVVEGYRYWLWSYGLPADDVKKDVQTMYAGGDNALPLLQKYQVQYVLISDYERKSLNAVNEPFFERYFPLVYQHGGIDIYRIRRASPGEGHERTSLEYGAFPQREWRPFLDVIRITCGAGGLRL